ncbi:Protein M3 [Mortierella sp. AD010]|nr:Protein M3 [Mortierella sp. AD010]
MAKHGLLSPAGAKVVAGLILNYTLPALLFAKMITCVDRSNVGELGFIALVAVFYITLGAFMGLIIQRTKLVPKRLYWGIVAATMFTNFGDLPISIILAVSDHPPFLVGDGPRGTTYSSVFIAVFYLFLFPLGGYRLIRYDHVKETERLQNLIREHNNHEQSNSNDCALSENAVTLSPDSIEQQQLQQQLRQSQHLSSPGHHYQPQHQGQGISSSFSATSTMISMDCPPEDNTKELRYRPNDREESGSPCDTESPSHGRFDSSSMESSSLPRATNPFIHAPTQNDDNSSSDSDRSSPTPFSQRQHSYPLQNLRSDGRRYSIDSMASSGTGATRFSAGHDDDHNLIQPMSKAGGPMRKKSLRSPVFNGYQPPPLHPHSNSGSSSTSPLRLTPPVRIGVESCAVGNANGATDNMATVSLGPTDAEISMEPLPKVPPALQNAYNSTHSGRVHWFWRIFHSTREYLTPPTIGLLVGLSVALTPLRDLFITTSDPLSTSTPDDLPILGFILDVTLLLGGCCVPLGLTVLGASLSRLKPGRMRPLVPTMAMITIAKLVISPCIGIMLVQFVFVQHFGWVPAQNHMLRFTLMLTSGSPTSITCFVLAQVWDRRTKNAGSEMAAIIAVQYAVSVVSLTIGSACMMYYLF